MDHVLVTVAMAFPTGLVVAEPADEPGGLPKRIERASRVPALHGLVVKTVAMALGPVSPTETMRKRFPEHDLAQLSALVGAGSLDEAGKAAQPILEGAIDAIAFQMQAALHVTSLSFVDVTPPLADGDEREYRVDANGEASVAPKFSPMPQDFTWDEVPVMTPTLHLGRYPADVPVRMALWWYVKGLDTPFAVDKFTAFWTALEILWSASDVREIGPYTPPCGHELATCPDCEASVVRVVRGKSLKRFLVERTGASDGDAKAMWRLRQVVHGANVFDVERLPELGRLTSVLRAGVLGLLKSALGDPHDEPPLMVRAYGPILGPVMSLGGHRPLDRDDLALVDFLSSLTAGTTPGTSA